LTTDRFTKASLSFLAVLTQKERDSATWQAQWAKAVERTAGIAPHLEKGSDYVEGIRSTDAKHLSGFGSEAPLKHAWT
jgi:hypothetical protein